MKPCLSEIRVCAVTLPKDPYLLSNIEKVLQCGVKWVQYRAKDKSRKELYLEALRIKELTDNYNALLTINDYVDLALVINAKSLHLGQDDLPLDKVKTITPQEMTIGISTHSIEEAIYAEKMGANYIGFGSVFKTNTKDVGEPKGIGLLKEVIKRVNIPVVAIGGINTTNIVELINDLTSDNKGSFCVAMSSGIFNGNIVENCKILARLNLLD